MKPTLEEVKAYFKNAKEVKGYHKTFDISNVLERIRDKGGDYWVFLENGYDAIVWDNQEGYAEIISYKEPQFEYLEEVEVRDLGNVWLKCRYLTVTPKNKYVVLNCLSETVSSWDYIRKLNTERTQAIETIKELMTKHEIKTTEL